MRKAAASPAGGGERVAALEQWLWGWPRGRDPLRNPWGWGEMEGEERWVAAQCHHPPGGVSTAQRNVSSTGNGEWHPRPEVGDCRQ